MPMRVPLSPGPQVTEQPLPNAYQSTNATPDLLGAAGQQEQAFGNAAVNAGGEAARIYADQVDMGNSLRVDDALNKATEASLRLQHDPKIGFTTQKGIDAVNRQSGLPLADEYTKSLQQTVDDISNNDLKNDRQKAMFAMKVNNVVTSFRGQAMTYETQAFREYNLSTRSATATNATNALVLNFKDPDNVEAQTTRIRASIVGGIDDTTGKFVPGSAQMQGLSAAQGTELATAAVSHAHLEAMKLALDQNDVSSAMQYFGLHNKEMTAPDIVAVNGTLRRAVQNVAARDTAHALISGRNPTDPDTLAPVTPGRPLQGNPTEQAATMQRVVMQMESGGDPNAVSPKGAKGAMQVMDATAADPGFGVRPAKLGDDGKPLPGELERVGRDYLGAMTARYDNPAIVMAAYNAGPGVVDKWLMRYGDPRTGQVSAEDWAKRIPFKETRSYVANGLKQLNESTGNSGAPIQGVTGNMLKDRLYTDVTDRARAIAEKQFPGDVAYSDSLVTRVQQQGRQVVADQFAQQRAANDVLISGLIGSKPDGSDKAQDIDTLLSRPGARAAWDVATPETKLALQQRLAKGDSKWDEQSFGTYYKLLGQAGNDPSSFVDVDLSKMLGQIPDDKLVQLANMQRAINTNDSKQQAKQASYLHADSLAESMLKPLGLGRTAKANGAKSADTNLFYGQLHEAVDAFQAANGKRPADADVMKIAAGLLAAGKQGGMLWDTATPAFKSEDLGKFYVPLPSDKTQRSALAASFQRVAGRAPSDAELQQWYTKYKLAGGK